MVHPAPPEAPVRAFALCLLLSLLLFLLAAPAFAADAAILRVHAGDQATPADGSWPLGVRQEPSLRIDVRAHPEIPGGFLVEITPLQGTKGAAAVPKPGPARLCAGLASAARRDLYKTRAVELRIRASRPAPGILVMTSSNTQDRASRDRVFGLFVIGGQWKNLRLPYGTLAPMPGWAEDSRRLGLAPGDNVFRPDSVEDFCLGVEADRLQEGGPLSLEIDALRFVR